MNPAGYARRRGSGCQTLKESGCQTLKESAASLSLRGLLERKLPRKVLVVFLENEVDPFPNVDGDRHFRSLVE